MSAAEALFAMVVATRPVSSQSANTRPKYQARLSEEARGWFRDRPRLKGSLYLWIMWFQRSPTGQDTDNIAKPISDALNGIIYDDDNSVTKYLIERILYSGDVQLLSNTIPAPVYKKLVSLIAQGEADILLRLATLQHPASILVLLWVDGDRYEPGGGLPRSGQTR